jgi:GTP-binding protein
MLDLFLSLGADDELADFPYLFGSGRDGYVSTDPQARSGSMQPLFDMILDRVPGPEVQPDEPLSMLVTTLDWSEYVGRIAVGRIQSGRVAQGQNVALMQAEDQTSPGRVVNVHTFDKLGRVEVPEATAGDIAAIVGLENVEIGDTISDAIEQRALPRLLVDQPTLEMVFTINTSPFAGQDGKYVTTRHLRARLMKELERNVALRVRPMDSADSFAVAGRGVLHLSVLIETMRREGYELAIGKPHVILQEVEGQKHEPFESLVVEVPSERLGPVMELVGQRRGELLEMHQRGTFAHVTFIIPARGLIGLRTRLLTATQGEAIVHHRFDSYRPMVAEPPGRPNGVLVSMVGGRVNGFALNTLQ